jgi:hypothetical protein
MQISLASDFRAARDRFKNLSDVEVKRAAARALNRAGVAARQAAAPIISAELKGIIPEPVVRRGIKFTNARADKLYIDIRAVGGRRIAARRFKPKQTRTGVTIRVGASVTQLEGAFITPSGAVRVRGPNWNAQFAKELILRRNRLPGDQGGRKNTKKGKPDYPIPQVFIPGVPRVFLESVVVAAITRAGGDRFRSEFSRELAARSKGLVKGSSNG